MGLEAEGQAARGHLGATFGDTSGVATGQTHTGGFPSDRGGANNDSKWGRTSMRQTRNCLLVTAALAIGLLTPIAVASAGGSPVVPPSGKVAGKGYGYWMERFWQYLFASGRLVPG